MSDKTELKPCQNSMCALHGNKGNNCLYWGEDTDVESCCCYSADPVRRFENVNDAIFTESELAKQLAEATKEIAQLRADLAKPSEWISVKTELPGDGKPKAMYSVIVAKTNGVVLEAMYNNLVYKFLSTKFDDLNHPVTHWQPLPSPPAKTP